MIGPLLQRLGLGLALSGLVQVRSGYGKALPWVGLGHFLWILPSLLRNQNPFGSIARGFQAEANEVWLTIDDGPSPLDTCQILDTLDEAGAKASFFVIGKKVEAHPVLAQMILQAGHSLENHTYSHAAGSFWSWPANWIARDLDRCTHAIRKVGAPAPRYFRAPAGLVNASLSRELVKRNLPLVGWSAAGLDGTSHFQPRAALARIRRDLQPGAILLVHQGHGMGRADFLREVLREIHQKGLRTVRPDPEMLLTLT